MQTTTTARHEQLLEMALQASTEITDPLPRVHALLRFLKRLPFDLRPRLVPVIKQAAEAIEELEERVRLLLGTLVSLSLEEAEDMLSHAFEIAEQAADPVARMGALGELSEATTRLNERREREGAVTQG